MKRGHSVNWEDVRKEWSRTPVQKGPEFCQLLSGCHSPGKCLQSLTQGNLVALLRTSEPTHRVYIARAVLKNRAHQQPGQSFNLGADPYNTAIWIVFLSDPETMSVRSLLDLTDPESAGGSPSAEGAESRPQPCPNLFGGLMWAQRNARDMSQTTLDAKQRTVLLQQALVYVTVHHPATECSQLWSGLFARLLDCPTADSERQWQQTGGSLAMAHSLPVQLPVAKLREVLRFPSGSQDWPAAVQDLFDIIRAKAPADLINRLWTTPSHRFLLLEERSSERLAQVLTPGIVRHTGGSLESTLQMALLTTNTHFLADEVNGENLLKVTEGALRGLSVQSIQLQDGSGPIYNAVVAEVKRCSDAQA